MENEETVYEEVEQPKKSGIYKNTTTSKSLTGPPVLKRKVLSAPAGLKTVTPKENRTFRYGKKWYELKRGEQQAVPLQLFEDLVRCDVIVER